MPVTMAPSTQYQNTFKHCKISTETSTHRLQKTLSHTRFSILNTRPSIFALEYKTNRTGAHAVNVDMVVPTTTFLNSISSCSNRLRNHVLMPEVVVSCGVCEADQYTHTQVRKVRSISTTNGEHLGDIVISTFLNPLDPSF